VWRIRLISGRPRQFPEVFAFIDGTEPDSASNLIRQLAQINTSSASGKLNLHAFAAMAEFERKLIRACMPRNCACAWPQERPAAET
jgi:hypothetical protein